MTVNKQMILPANISLVAPVSGVSNTECTNVIAAAALPERLLCTLAMKAISQKRSLQEICFITNRTRSSPELLQALASIDRDCSFVSYRPGFTTIQRVLLGHPCTAVNDWIGLLADIGRGWRAAVALDVQLEVLVAGVAWMRSNRSFSQFARKSLTASQIETGLCLNLDRRRRLYSALSIRQEVKDVSNYGYGGNLAKERLESIAAFYSSLSQVVYGTEDGALTAGKCSIIAKKQLDADSLELPWAMKLLSEAGMLKDGENPDLEIVGRIARQFNRIDQQTFQYFFAQWFAQQPYRNSTLKCAVFSERPFDRLLDDLSGYIHSRWWSDNKDISCTTDKALPPLPAAYFPHYRIGTLQVLPYNPLSLDILRMKLDDHLEVEKRICSLEGEIDVPWLNRPFEADTASRSQQAAR